MIKISQFFKSRDVNARPEVPTFLKTDGRQQILESKHPEMTKANALEVLDKGYTVVRGALPSDITDAAVRAFWQFTERNQSKCLKYRDGDGHYPRFINLHAAVPELYRLFEGNTASLGVLDLLFGSETALYTSLFFERGTAQPLHRDTPYFSTIPEYSYFGVWVALEDTDDSNGALQVVEGGHKIGELDREKIALKHYKSLAKIKSDSPQLWDDYQGSVVAECQKKGCETKSVFAKKGDTIIWHPQLPHGGGAIKDIKRTRLSFVAHVTPLKTPVYHMDVFFNPKKNVSSEPPWKYQKVGNRQCRKTDEVGIGHSENFRLKNLNL